MPFVERTSFARLLVAVWQRGIRFDLSKCGSYRLACDLATVKVDDCDALLMDIVNRYG